MKKYCFNTVFECGLPRCGKRGCILNSPLTDEEKSLDEPKVHAPKSFNTEFRPAQNMNIVASKVRNKKRLNVLEKSYLNWLNTNE